MMEYCLADATEDGYELLAVSFDGTVPRFPQRVKEPKIESRELTIYYSMQCPYVRQGVETVTKNCPVCLIIGPRFIRGNS